MRESVSLTTERKTTKAGVVEYWALRWRDASGRQRSQSLGRVDQLSATKARKAQRAKLAEFETTPDARNVKRGTTAGAVVEWVNRTHGHKLSARTRDIYRLAAAYFLEYFGTDCRMETITPAAVAEFEAELSAGTVKPFEVNTTCNAVSVNLYLRTLRAMVSKAAKVGFVASNPFAGHVGNVKQTKGWHYVTPDEYRQIMDAASPKIGLVISLCRLAGLRREEASTLCWTNIDWQAGHIVITGSDDWQPKDRERRTIPICPELHALLLAAFEAAAEGQARVCGDLYAGNVTRDVRNAVKRAKVEVYSKPLHTLRKSCITDWAAKFPIHAVQEWAGHAKITTTQQFYLKVSPADYERATRENFWNVSENVRKTAEAENEPKKASA